MIFLNSASSAAALDFYLPGVCTHTDTEGKQRKARVRNIFKKSEKIQYLMNTLYLVSTVEEGEEFLPLHQVGQLGPLGLTRVNTLAKQ